MQTHHASTNAETMALLRPELQHRNASKNATMMRWPRLQDRNASKNEMMMRCVVMMMHHRKGSKNETMMRCIVMRRCIASSRSETWCASWSCSSESASPYSSSWAHPMLQWGARMHADFPYASLHLGVFLHLCANPCTTASNGQTHPWDRIYTWDPLHSNANRHWDQTIVVPNKKAQCHWANNIASHAVGK